VVLRTHSSTVASYQELFARCAVLHSLRGPTVPTALLRTFPSSLLPRYTRAVHSLFSKRLLPFTRALAKVGTWNAEAIHQSRVGSRRLRELVPLLEIGHDVQCAARKQLRQVTRRLGRLREVDVQAQILREYRGKGHDNRAVDHLEDAIGVEIQQTREWLTGRLGEGLRERLVGTLGRSTGSLALPTPPRVLQARDTPRSGSQPPMRVPHGMPPVSCLRLTRPGPYTLPRHCMTCGSR
jgi:CHAD domain